MKWRGRERSRNIEDRRGQAPPGGMGRGLRLGGKTGGLGLLVIVAVIVLSGGDVGQILGTLLGAGGDMAPTTQVGSQTVPQAPAPTEATEFVSVILRDTEETWNTLFSEAGARYQEPRLVLFSNAVDSACGYASAATGPFYCPGDHKVYLDTSFFNELARLGAPGDFAQAYVIAHEVGHHVQNLSSTLPKVSRMQQARPGDANALQVLVELQADCLAGVWAHRAETQRDLLEAGDVEEGLQAAASIGDDRLMRNAGRRVQPESFTHGSSAQRVEWFRRGMRTGQISACDTFAEAGVRL